jgi:hypothetical protein
MRHVALRATAYHSTEPWFRTKSKLLQPLRTLVARSNLGSFSSVLVATGLPPPVQSPSPAPIRS